MQYHSIISHIPLLLTVIRCAGAFFFPPLLYYFLGSFEPVYCSALGSMSMGYILTQYPAPLLALLYALLALTDYFDGVLARNYASESQLGRLLDPFADKLLVAGPLVVLAFQGIVSLTLVCVVIARELFVTTLREYSAELGISLRVQQIGKIKTVVQMGFVTAILFCDIRYTLLGFAGEALVIGITLLSAFVYARTFYRQRS